MKRAFFLLLVVGSIAATGLIGCSAANKFIGTWETQITQLGQTGTMVQTINADGTFNGNLTVQIPTGEMKVAIDGTWTSPDEKSITLTQKNVTLSGVPKEAEAFIKPGIEKNKDKPQTMTVTWNGADEFSASGGQGTPPMTFKRKK